MKKNFDRSVDFVLKWEGGYVCDNTDPGGETNFGISKKAYPNLDIRNLSKQDAKDIYYRDYWRNIGCDGMEYPLDIISFDTGVNCGVTRVHRWIDSTNSNSCALLAKRLEHYTYLIKVNPKLIRFLCGWVNRVVDLVKEIGRVV